MQFFASLNIVDRCKKSRVKREQLRCCNWIQLSKSQSIALATGEGGKKAEVG
jgi:hypothetical protein